MRPNAFESLEEARFANLFTSKREFHFICGLEEVNYVRRVSKLFSTRLNRFADAITTGLGRLCHFVLVCFGAAEAVSSAKPGNYYFSSVVSLSLLLLSGARRRNPLELIILINTHTLARSQSKRPACVF